MSETTPIEPSPQAGDQQPRAREPRNFPRWLTITSLALNGALFLGLVGVGIPVVVTTVAQAQERAADEAQAAADIEAAEYRKRNLFRRAAIECDSSPTNGVVVLTGGAGLDIDGAAGFLGSGAAFPDQQCILDELGAPATVASRMQGTRALDGTQEAEWDDIIVRWTYHPDNGLDSVIEFTN